MRIERRFFKGWHVGVRRWCELGAPPRQRGGTYVTLFVMEDSGEVSHVDRLAAGLAGIEVLGRFESVTPSRTPIMPMISGLSINRPAVLSDPSSRWRDVRPRPVGFCPPPGNSAGGSGWLAKQP